MAGHEDPPPALLRALVSCEEGQALRECLELLDDHAPLVSGQWRMTLRTRLPGLLAEYRGAGAVVDDGDDNGHHVLRWLATHLGGLRSQLALFMADGAITPDVEAAMTDLCASACDSFRASGYFPFALQHKRQRTGPSPMAAQHQQQEQPFGAPHAPAADGVVAALFPGSPQPASLPPAAPEAAPETAAPAVGDTVMADGGVVDAVGGAAWGGGAGHTPDSAPRDQPPPVEQPPRHHRQRWHSRLAAASHPALPEPVVWALRVVMDIGALVEESCALGQLEPGDTDDDLHTALGMLATLCSDRMHGLQFSLAALQSLADAWLHGYQQMRCLSPECGAPSWPLSLRATVQHYLENEAASPAQPLLHPGLALTQLATKRLPLYTLSPSLLGRFYELGQCQRFLHLRSDRGRQSAPEEQRERDGAEACLETLSLGSAMLAKGLRWEAVLNTSALHPQTGTYARRCPPGLRGTDPAPPGDEQLRFVDLAEVAYMACTCDCRAPPAGIGRKNERGRERLHARDCPFNEVLLRESAAALFDATRPQPGGYDILYQAKFEVPEELYTYKAAGGAHGEQRLPFPTAGAIHAVRFAKFQPDYLAVLRVAGTRVLVVIDAKASGKVKQSHQVQVAFYSWMLRRMLALEEQRRGLPSGSLGTVASHGAVWRPPESQGGESVPEIFSVCDLEEDLEVLLQKLVTTTLTLESHQAAQAGRHRGQLCLGQPWRLQHSCQGCDFEPSCRAEAEADPMQHLPRGDALLELLRQQAACGQPSSAALTDELRAALAVTPQRPSQSTPPEIDISPMQAWLLRVPPHGTVGRLLSGVLGLTHAPDGQLAVRPPRGWASLSPVMQAGDTHALVVAPQAIAPGLPCPPPPGAGCSEWAILVTLALDPASQEVYAWAVHDVNLPPAHGCASEAQQRAGVAGPATCCAPKGLYDPSPLASSTDVNERLQMAPALLSCLYHAFNRCTGKRACMYVLEAGEKGALLSLLAAAASGALGVSDDNVLRWAEAVLFYLLDGRIIEAQHTQMRADSGERERLLLEADAPRLCCLSTEAYSLLYLPVPGFSTLNTLTACLAPSGALPWAPDSSAGGPSPRALSAEDGSLDEARSAAATFLLGIQPGSPDNVPTGIAPAEALRRATEDVGTDAVFRDWSAVLVAGEPRVCTLMARRTRLALLLLTGLRRELLLASRLVARGSENLGIGWFCPSPAPLCTPQSVARGPVSSTIAASTALFKWMEQRLSALHTREERALPLAVRVAKGKACAFTVTSFAAGRDGKVECAASTKVEASQQHAVMALLRDKYGSFLVAPTTRRGLLDSLRFPDSVLCEHTVGRGATLWDGLCGGPGKELAAGLQLGQVTHVSGVAPDSADPNTLTFKLAVQLESKAGVALTALNSSHLQVGCSLVLHNRFCDNTSQRVVRSAHRLPHDAGHVLDGLVIGTEVLVGDPESSTGVYCATFLCYAKPPEGQGIQPGLPRGAPASWVTWDPAPGFDLKPGSRAWGWVQVVVSDGRGHSPDLVHLPVQHLLSRHSLYRQLLTAPAPAQQHWAVPPDGLQLLPAGLTPEAVVELHRDDVSPTDSQSDVFAAVVQRRLSTVWGPPGTGKTHWSVGLLFTLLHAHAQRNAPLRVLVTAQAWDAVHLLLARLRARLAAANEPWAAGVETLDLAVDGQKHALGADMLWRTPLCVIFSTVWQAANKMGPQEQRPSPGPVAMPRVCPKLDLLLCDEASQMTTADALLVLDLVDPVAGRVVAMGDHLQLPPIQKGAYPQHSPGGRPWPWNSLLNALRASLGGCVAARAHRDACVLLDNHRMVRTHVCCFLVIAF